MVVRFAYKPCGATHTHTLPSLKHHTVHFSLFSKYKGRLKPKTLHRKPSIIFRDRVGAASVEVAQLKMVRDDAHDAPAHLLAVEAQAIHRHCHTKIGFNVAQRGAATQAKVPNNAVRSFNPIGVRAAGAKKKIVRNKIQTSMESAILPELLKAHAPTHVAHAHDQRVLALKLYDGKGRRSISVHIESHSIRFKLTCAMVATRPLLK